MSEVTPLQILGAGPAGLSLMLALANRMTQLNGPLLIRAQNLFEQLIVFEGSANAGGRMGHYQINANTSSPDVVQGMDEGTVFRQIHDQYLSEPETANPLISLPRIEKLMVQPLVALVKEILGSRLRAEQHDISYKLQGRWISTVTIILDRLQAHSENLVLCCGGKESILPELIEFENKTVMSDDFLLQEKFKEIPRAEGPIVIVGASHSAFSCAWRLLNDPQLEAYRTREIVMLQRRKHIKVRCSPAFAERHKIPYNPLTDLGPVNGLVYAHAGLRKDAKWLYLDIRDGREKRVNLKTIKSLLGESEMLESAGLILQATGSIPNLPQFEIDGEVAEIGQPTKSCELRRMDTKKVVPGLFGYGLGFNIVPDGESAGEKSFSGGIHGFQSYPLALSPKVVEKIINRLN